MGVESPSARIWRATSMPFISGRRQSMIYAWKTSLRSRDCRARRTASLPERVHSERIPTFTSILVTLSQVLKSSSTTRALSPSSSSIFSSALSADRSRSGMQMINSVPLPCSVRTSMVPPIISTMFLVIAMPRPVPWMRLTVELRSRSKGSNTCCAKVWLMPIPVSLIRISYIPFPSEAQGSWATRTEIVPPVGVNLMALDSRFSST